MQMLGDLAVATADHHETAAMMFRGMKEIFYSRWDPDISTVELDCIDPRVSLSLSLSVSLSLCLCLLSFSLPCSLTRLLLPAVGLFAARIAFPSCRWQHFLFLGCLCLKFVRMYACMYVCVCVPLFDEALRSQVLEELETTMLAHALDGDRAMLFEHLCVLLKT